MLRLAGRIEAALKGLALTVTRPDRFHWPLRKVTDLEEQRRETYHYWASRPICERLNTIAELSRAVYSIQKVGKPRAEEPD